MELPSIKFAAARYAVSMIPERLATPPARSASARRGQRTVSWMYAHSELVFRLGAGSEVMRSGDSAVEIENGLVVDVGAV